MPFGYNLGVKVRQVVPKLWGKVEPAVIHYVHRPKPWEESLADPDSAMSRLVRRLGIEPLTRAWRYRCVGAPPGDLDALTAADRAALFAKPPPTGPPNSIASFRCFLRVVFTRVFLFFIDAEVSSSDRAQIAQSRPRTSNLLLRVFVPSFIGRVGTGAY